MSNFVCTPLTFSALCSLISDVFINIHENINDLISVVMLGDTHLYCLAVQAGFYSDMVECLTATQEILVRSSAWTKGV